MNIFKSLQHYLISLMIRKMFRRFVNKHKAVIEKCCDNPDTIMNLIPGINTTTMAVTYFVKLCFLIDYITIGVNLNNKIIRKDLTVSEYEEYKKAIILTAGTMAESITKLLPNSKDSSVLIHIITDLDYRLYKQFKLREA